MLIFLIAFGAVLLALLVGLAIAVRKAIRNDKDWHAST